MWKPKFTLEKGLTKHTSGLSRIYLDIHNMWYSDRKTSKQIPKLHTF